MTYEWEGRLRSATAQAATLDIVYDPDGNRVQRSCTRIVGMASGPACG